MPVSQQLGNRCPGGWGGPQYFAQLRAARDGRPACSRRLEVLVLFVRVRGVDP